MFDYNQIDRVNLHKHLGIYLTPSLDWAVQLHEVCLKANRKLSVLRSVKLLSRQTLDQLYKLVVRSVIDYGLPIYCKQLRQKELARLENIQYRAAIIVTGAYHFTSRDKLNCQLGWESIQKRGDVLGLSIFHKIHKCETRPLIRTCMPKTDIERSLNLRSRGCYLQFKNPGKKFKESFLPHISAMWNELPVTVQGYDMLEFKHFIKKDFKPPRFKHFSRGNNLSNRLLTQIRVGRSDLNQHKSVRRKPSQVQARLVASLVLHSLWFSFHQL